MDSTANEGYQNPENAGDVNKQEPFSQNTMDYHPQDNFTAEPQLETDGFQIEGSAFIGQQVTITYNPPEPVEQVSYQQDELIQNVTNETYSPSQDKQLPESLTQQPDIDSSVLSNNSNINEEQIIQNDTSVLPEVNCTENMAVEDINTNLPEHPVDTSSEQPNESIVDNTLKTNNDDTKIEEFLGEIQNCKAETSQDDGTVKKQVGSNSIVENIDLAEESSTNDEVKKDVPIEIIAKDSENANSEPMIEVIDELVDEETAEKNLELLKNYEPVPDVQEQSIFNEESADDNLMTQEDQSEGVQTAILSEDTTEEQTAQKPKQRKTRKPIHDLPMHLIGHDISKPVENVPNGRSLPKPRLGVKVPYRNLTSQIVSKAELEEVIIERSRAKEQATNKNDNTFARSLTQRLANKIAPEKDKKIKTSSENGSRSVEQNHKEDEHAEIEKQSSGHLSNIDESKIENDDDLLAILEGEGEEIPVIPKETENTQIDDSNLKLLEREIALQQLQELPHQVPKERITKHRQLPKAPLKLDHQQPKSKPDPSPQKPSQKSVAQSKPENTSKKSTPAIDLDIPSPVKKPIEVEPQVKVNMVLKTYSRKRKPSDIPDFEAPSAKRPVFEDPDVDDIYEKGDPLALPSDVYITKSSRVIKKKVIWDPDDDQTSRPMKPSACKVDNKSSPKTAKPTSVEKTEKKLTAPLDKKSEVKVVIKSAEKINDEKLSPKKIIPKNKSPPKSKRGLSEVDRLLMDEGAVKMLYDLKSTDENAAKKKKDVYSVEKAEKEILKRANLLKNDLVQNTSNESPKSLRKKEGPPITTPPPTKQPNPIVERKMSKDSTRSSVHTPPRSPTFFSSQASMLIRRRSSSSMSSEDDNVDSEDVSPKVAKSSKKSEGSKTKKLKRSANNESNKIIEKGTKESISKTVKSTQFKSFTIKKSGKHVSIDMNYIEDRCYFTLQVLDELTTALKKLEKDKECNVVSITSASKAFCLGLDYSSLVSENKEERVEKATSMAEAVREFLLCLLHFPKVLVAGIQNQSVGLGVTMLPLFDSVIANDAATFTTPYAELGCLGEGTFLLTYPNLTSSGLATELLYANQVLKADEALRRGLISKLCWPEKYNETLNQFLSAVAGGSRQSLETTKKQLRMHLVDQMETAIQGETEILIQHWTSLECQEKFSKISK